MLALVYHGPGRKAWEEVPDPGITGEGDATTAALRVVLTRGGEVGEW